MSFGAVTSLAQQAGSPAEMKPPGDPTSQTRSTTPATDNTNVNKPAAPEPAPVTDSVKSATPATAEDPATSNNANVPTTTIYPDVDPKSVLAPKLDPGPLPENKSALIGGRVRDIDQIRNEMTIDIFGKGGKMKVLFDPRTRFDRDGIAANQTIIKKGDQVYLDTQLVNHKIFARDVYIHTATGTADASGQITSYNAKTRELTINDQMSRTPVTVRLTPTTVIHSRDGAAGSPANLQYYALVSVKLSPGKAGGNEASEVDVIAEPGSQFTFFGTLTHIDLRSGLIAVDNKSDHKSYEIRFEPSQIPVTDDLKVGNEVAVNAVFNGRDYTANSLKVTPSGHSSTPE
jgi:hypothetical protein